MTISTATSLSESLPTGTKSQVVKTPETTSDVVARLDVRPQPRIVIKNSKPLAALMQEFESNPKMAAKLAEARRVLGSTVLRDEVHTLRALRLSAGLSQDQLAVRASTAQSHIARIETGKTDPGTDTIASIAAALGVGPEAVFAAVRAQRAARQRK